MRRLRPLLLICAILLSACERVVSLTVPESEPRLVVEARLERVRNAVSGRQRVKLTTTGSYFSVASPAPVRGAVVRVADDSGRVVTFAESATEPGVYLSTFFVITVGRTYTLRITHDGDEYASTETALGGVPIDSVYFRERTVAVGPVDGLRATIALRDPVGVKNFYLWDQFVDGRRLVSPDSESYSRVVASDDFRDGTRIRDFQPYAGIVVRPGQEVLVRQVSISEPAYQFYRALSEQSLNDGSPFGVQPANLRGNVANLTSPSRYALGYFIVAEVTEAAGIVL